MSRLVSMSRTGRYVVMQTPDAIEIVDALGTAPRARIAGSAIDFACVGTTLWLLRGVRIERFALASGRAIDAAITLPAPGTTMIADRGDGAHAVIVTGSPPVLVLGDAIVPIAPGPAAVFPLGGQRVAATIDGKLHLLELGRRDPVGTALRVKGEVISVHALYGGRVLAVLARAGDEDTWWVLRSDGTRVHQIPTPRAVRWAVAGDAGVACCAVDDGARWIWVDLRYGHVRARGSVPFAIDCLDVSCDAQHVVLTGATGGGAPQVLHMPAIELLSRTAAEPTADAPVDAHALQPSPPPPLDAAHHEEPAADPAPAAPAPAPARLRGVPLALGAPLPPLRSSTSTEWPPYGSAREHLDDLLDLVAARAARAIALAWNTGRLSAAGTDRQPFEREVHALLGHAPGFATGELREADEHLARMAARNVGRVRSTIAAGARLPVIELMRELELSPIAGHTLIVALAPNERGEIARLFGILSNDEQRPVVDRFLIETVLAGSERARRAEIAAELAGGSPLRRHGVLHVAGEPGQPAFEAITVDPVVIARLCDRATTAPTRSPRPLDELVLAPDAVRDLLLAVARPQSVADPLRLVLRGRRGSGRRSAVAALAAEVGRAVADLDCARLPRAGTAMAAALQQELRRAVLRGCIPIVSGLDSADPADTEGQDRIRQILRSHPGPLVIRAAPESSLPLEPGHETITLPPLSETERAAFWRTALERAGLTCRDIDGIAARWRIGPGVIEHVIAQVEARRVAADTRDTDTLLDDVARQHIASRLTHIATPVHQLADWEHVALADDVLDSIREFIGRVAHRKTVFERWGFDAKVASARGLTALFYGPPGTGKSMVAGLIARELGLELYRVDLARVVSKWIGETEKNLAEVFDAAEDGQVVILFDEADSLFAKRTEVKTSVDRYANLEVNYLLQRLDSFQGVAILTTNLDGSIDPAFKRRMSLRLQFPFPDEDMRKRLWAAHIPTETPIAGDFNFDELARRFPLSGGYIRNSALRAAFLAAQERRPLSQQHLLRAITLEYRDLGKLSTDGRME